MHEIIRERSLEAWAALKDGQPSPLARLLCEDERVLQWASAEEIEGWLDPSGYVGDAPERARALARMANNSPD
jgi:adenylosuccinate lyase